eukprot:CAMPEP_0206282078 /NCGR_PEP_ID=MMETSP0047_2-20121206/39493_1 /ASSEMBLY_ACC=CAM_ASM_000192 /TAXON_ID=195065 /ORGANISM="Chroomonas mesostigmatica_cf, Strain CCMP1168" /LENGTH=58 /DNA_ID=CAMNT_0053712329 /DNA_START=82 /DNA_END=255 /DNA_ORIENTATION=+
MTPSSVITIECDAPAAIIFTLTSPSAVTSRGLEVFVAKPSCPELVSPQLHTLPSRVSA